MDSKVKSRKPRASEIRRANRIFFFVPGFSDHVVAAMARWDELIELY